MKNTLLFVHDTYLKLLEVLNIDLIHETRVSFDVIGNLHDQVCILQAVFDYDLVVKLMNGLKQESGPVCVIPIYLVGYLLDDLLFTCYDCVVRHDHKEDKLCPEFKRRAVIDKKLPKHIKKFEFELSEHRGIPRQLGLRPCRFKIKFITMAVIALEIFLEHASKLFERLHVFLLIIPGSHGIEHRIVFNPLE